MGIGKLDFQKIWGKRKLEDNWRRKNKLSISENEPEETAENETQTNTPEAVKKISDPKTIAYYLQDIPLTDSLMEVSNEMIKSAMFNAGRIYRTDFNDFNRSIETLEELNRRFRGSIFELPALFELYQLYKANNNPTKTAEYKEKIISGYPGSKYAKYLFNPNYFAEIEERKIAVETKYGEALRLFQAYDFAKAHEVAITTAAMLPDSSLLPKVKFIELVANGPTQERPVFANSLDRYIKAYPALQTTALAQQIKDLIASNSLADYQQLVAKGYIKDEIVNEEMNGDKDHSNDDFGGKFSYDENMFHYYVIAFSKEAHVDVNRLIYDIANYNLDYYTSTDFDIEPISLDAKTQLVVVRSIPNKEESLIYFRSIMRKRPVFQALKGTEYVNFVTSSSNYRTIIAEKEYLEYLRFYIKNYSSYVGSDFPADELPNPQELLSKVRKEEEPIEKGKFVLLQPLQAGDSTSQASNLVKVKYAGPYSQKQSNEFCYTLIFLKKQTDQYKLIKAFESFNQANFGASSVKVTAESLDENRGMLIVNGLGAKNSALAFMEKSASDQSLSALFKAGNFRSFIISNENLLIFKKEKNLLQYMEFYNQPK